MIVARIPLDESLGRRLEALGRKWGRLRVELEPDGDGLVSVEHLEPWPLYLPRPDSTPWVEPPAVMESLSPSRITGQ